MMISKFTAYFKNFAVLMAVLVILVSMTGSYASSGTEGIALTSDANPIAGETYEIGSAEQLRILADLVNGGNNMKGVTFVLDADITLNAGDFTVDGVWSESGTPEEWTPIGGSSTAFGGVFDGGGHTIYGLYCDADTGFVGLFGFISDATVKNVNIKNSYISGQYYVGGIAGYAISINGGTEIEGCSVSAFIDCASSYTGAVVGYASRVGDASFEISDCSTESNVPVTGLIQSDISLSGNNEVISEPPASDGNGLGWLMILLIVLLCIIALAALVFAAWFLIKFIKKKLKDKPKKEKTIKEKTKKTKKEKKEKPKKEKKEKPEKPKKEKKKKPKKEKKEKTPKVKKVKEKKQPEPEPEPEEIVPPEPVDRTVTVVLAEEPDDDAFVGAFMYAGESDDVGYYYIKKTLNDNFLFTLNAPNHSVLVTSEVYSTFRQCKINIRSIAANVAAAVTIQPDTAEKAAQTNAPTKPAAASTEAAKESDFAESDNTTAEAAPESAKIEIYTGKTGKFHFTYKSADNEITLSSPAYASLTACRNGIEIFIKNAQSRRIVIENDEIGEKREKLRAEITKAKKITVDEANTLIDDSIAEVFVEAPDDYDDDRELMPAVTVYTDVISENFENGETVNLEALVDKGLIPDGTLRIRIEARGHLEKKLIIETSQISSDAFKMIMIAGGRTIIKND